MRTGLLFLLLLACAPARADRIEAVRVIRAHEIIAAVDVVQRAAPGTAGPSLKDIIG